MNLKTLDLNLLIVFDALLRTRSTTLAGERIGLTQSAVSNALKRLRGAFKDPLFVKTPQGMMPTPLAEKLAGPLQEGLERIKTAVEDRRDFDPARTERSFKLYVSDVGQMVFLPKLVGHLGEAAPGVSVVTIDAKERDAEALMAGGEIDLAVGFFYAFEAGFHRQKLFNERYVCLVSASHPRIKGRLALEQFLEARHAVYRPAAGSHSMIEDAVDRVFAAHGARRRVALSVSHSLGLAQIIAASDLVISIPSRLARLYVDYAAVKILPLPFESPRFDITQQWHERLHHDAGHRWLRGVVMKTFGTRS